jgi:hypothetical protein
VSVSEMTTDQKVAGSSPAERAHEGLALGGVSSSI